MNGNLTGSIFGSVHQQLICVCTPQPADHTRFGVNANRAFDRNPINGLGGLVR